MNSFFLEEYHYWNESNDFDSNTKKDMCSCIWRKQTDRCCQSAIFYKDHQLENTAICNDEKFSFKHFTSPRLAVINWFFSFLSFILFSVLLTVSRDFGEGVMESIYKGK